MAGDPVLRSQVLLELRPGEKLLWAGKPNPRSIVMQRGDEVAGAGCGVIFTLLILIVFPLLGRIINVRSMQIALSVTGAIVVSAMIFSILVPIYRYLMARGIVYGLTDRRAVIIQPKLRGKTVKSFAAFEPLERRDLADGAGDLTFGEEPYNPARPLRSRKIGFFGIANVREVEEMMLETFNNPAKTDDEQ